MSVKGRIWELGKKKAQRVTGRAPDKYRRQLLELKKRRLERRISEHIDEHINEHECPDYDE